MKFKATVQTMSQKGEFASQGKATPFGLQHLGFDYFASVRVGKRVKLEIEAEI